MKYIKSFEKLNIEDIQPDVLYKYSNSGYMSIGKLKKNNQVSSEYKYIFYDFIDNSGEYMKNPGSTKYIVKSNREMTVKISELIYFTKATPDEIYSYDILVTVDKYNL